MWRKAKSSKDGGGGGEKRVRVIDGTSGEESGLVRERRQ